MSLGWSVGRSVGRLVGQSVGWSVGNAFVQQSTLSTYWPTWPCLPKISFIFPSLLMMRCDLTPWLSLDMHLCQQVWNRGYVDDEL